MASNVFEWVVRTAMLVLAGLVTLSIIGSIAAMSNQAGEIRLGDLRERPAMAPVPEAEPPPTAVETAPPAAPPADPAPVTTAPEAATGELVTAPAPPEPPRPERWLEAIAFALLAIAGLLALLLILLWRGVSALNRIADNAALGQQSI
ncbi:MAG TPA: hypothetical protein VGB48_00730 [Allosphingosinicella sp.]|jgi:hypothetical protein